MPNVAHVRDRHTHAVGVGLLKEIKMNCLHSDRLEGDHMTDLIFSLFFLEGDHMTVLTHNYMLNHV